MDQQGAGARDGAIDFSHYSDAQLRDLRLHMDRQRFPENFARLEAEISRRESGEGSVRFSIRFTPADGLLGWLQALLSHLPFYGVGSIAPAADEVLIEGWQRTWLGIGQLSEVAIASGRIRNVYREGACVSFDVLRRFWWPRHYTVIMDSSGAAAGLTPRLPSARSKWFEKQSASIQQFYSLQRTPGHRPWVTPCIVALSLTIYLVMAAKGTWLALDGDALLAWEANASALTVHGGWWRLIAELFLHLNLLHLTVNMWVLWSVGRLAERLFGNISFICLYFAAGIMGGLLSIGWNPAGFSVGASGAIFGILGAFLAYLLHGSTRIPQPVMRAHLIPTVLFTVFSIANGLLQTGIDNAAHVGGLFTGLLLGWGLAEPAPNLSGRLRAGKSAIALFLVLASATALILQATGPAATPSPRERFLTENDWYQSGEAQNLALWQRLAGQASAGTIASADLADQFEHNIIPFWQKAVPHLRRQISAMPAATKDFGAAVVDFAQLRLRWARAIAASAHSGNPQEAIDLMQKTDAAQARLDWFALRTEYDHRATSLSSNPVVVQLSNLAWFNYRPCTKNPLSIFNPIASTDLASDSPAHSAVLGCTSQQLFLAYDFRQLEKTLSYAREHPYDLADGSSSYDALIGGLDDLFDYGGLSVNQVMDRLAAWRRAVPGSVHAELEEVLALESWAYAARGYGFADSVSALNQMVFLHRAEMAEASLKAIEPNAGRYSLWYQLAIGINLLRNGTEAERRAIFDKAMTRIPDNLNIDAAMMRSLMPRWGGSFQKVADFIVERANRGASGMAPDEKYALLYWRYAAMEGKEANIFKDVYAKPEFITSGFAVAVHNHPRSDYLANAAGRMACQSGQQFEYEVFHRKLPAHYSASVWSPDFTIESCNKKFGLKPARPDRASR